MEFDSENNVSLSLSLSLSYYILLLWFYGITIPLVYYSYYTISSKDKNKSFTPRIFRLSRLSLIERRFFALCSYRTEYKKIYSICLKGNYNIFVEKLFEYICAENNISFVKVNRFDDLPSLYRIHCHLIFLSNLIFTMSSFGHSNRFGLKALNWLQLTWMPMIKANWWRCTVSQ